MISPQPGHYLGHLIGHEGPGSLLSELKARGELREIEREGRGERGRERHGEIERGRERQGER